MRKPSKQVYSTQGRIVGPGAASLKYDLLTALLVTAAQDKSTPGRLALRLSLVMTARFNWQSRSFAVGLRELANMWGVTERTAKREMALMRERGWIHVDVPSARGRVARHGISLPNVLRDTMLHWDAVGPDFTSRMTGTQEPADNVIPLRATQENPTLPPEDPFGWAVAAAVLSRQDGAIYDTWFAGLRAVECQSGTLILRAPSRFIADYVRTHYHARILATITTINTDVLQIAIHA